MTGETSNYQAVPQRLLYSVAEAKQLLGGISQTTFYELLKNGDLAVVRIGRRTYVAADELARLAREGAR